jgi:hypothetical protein
MSRATTWLGLVVISIWCSGCVTQSLLETTKTRSHIEVAQPWFTTNDILDAPSLAHKLQTGADPVSAYLVHNFRPAERKRLDDYNLGTENTHELRRNLADALNDSIGRLEIYSSNRFANITLRPQTRAMFGVAGEQKRLYRLLLEDAYPLELAKIPDNKTVIDQKGRPANYLLMPAAIAADVALSPVYLTGALYFLYYYGLLGNDPC